MNLSYLVRDWLCTAVNFCPAHLEYGGSTAALVEIEGFKNDFVHTGHKKISFEPLSQWKGRHCVFEVFLKNEVGWVADEPEVETRIPRRLADRKQLYIPGDWEVRTLKTLEMEKLMR